MRYLGKTSLMNNSKWKELRLGMLRYGGLVAYRMKNVETGYICDWDREWYYHFQEEGYDWIEWVELEVESDEQRNAVESVLRAHHIPFERGEKVYRVYGYASDTSVVTYIE